VSNLELFLRELSVEIKGEPHMWRGLLDITNHVLNVADRVFPSDLATGLRAFLNPEQSS
jgi:hypothetical protein